MYIHDDARSKVSKLYIILILQLIVLNYICFWSKKTKAKITIIRRKPVTTFAVNFFILFYFISSSKHLTNLLKLYYYVYGKEICDICEKNI